MAKSDTYYKILEKYGLPRNASFEEIRVASRREMSKVHPDKVGEEYTQIFQNINNDFSKLILEYQVDEFSQLIDAHKKKTTDKDILELCSNYKFYLPRIRFASDVSSYKERFENEINKLYAEKKVQPGISRTTDSLVEKEKAKFRNYLEDLKRMYYFNNSIFQLIEETFYDIYRLNNINDIDMAKKSFEKEFLFHLKELFIYRIHKEINPYNRKDVIDFGNDFINRIKKSPNKEVVMDIYEDFKKKFNVKVVEMRKNFREEKSKFIAELENAKKSTSRPSLSSIISRYLDLTIHTADMSNLEYLKNSYRVEIEKSNERFKNSEFENARKHFVEKLQKDSHTYQRYNEVVLKISDYITRAKMSIDIEDLNNLVDRYEKEIIVAIKNALSSSVNEYSVLMNEEIYRATTKEQLASIQNRMRVHIYEVKDPLELAKDNAKKEIESVSRKYNRKHDLTDTFAVIDSKKTISEVDRFKNDILKVFSTVRTDSTKKRSFTAVEESEITRAAR